MADALLLETGDKLLLEDGSLLLLEQQAVTSIGGFQALACGMVKWPGLHPIMHGAIQYPALVAAAAAQGWDISTELGGGSLSDAYTYDTPAGFADYQIDSLTGHSSGKWYAEVQVVDEVNVCKIGLTNKGSTPPDQGGDANSVSYTQSGDVMFNSSTSSFPSNTYASGDYLRFAFDADSGKFWCGDAAGWCSGDPATGSSPVFTLGAGTWFLFAGGFSIFNAGQFIVNTGQAAFNFTAPSGFSAWG